MPKTWGGVARKGAAKIEPRDAADHRPRPAYRAKDRAAPPGSAAEAWARADADPDDLAARDAGPDTSESEEWILEGIEKETTAAVRRGRREAPASRPDRDESRAAGPKQGKAKRQRGSDPARVSAFARAVGPERAERLERRLLNASRAFSRERFGEARQILRAIAKEAPGVPDVRELLGLCAYREGRWREAIRELEAFHGLTHSTEQHPVLADCYRALGKWEEVERLWDELRADSPDADLVAEGRIVAAGALADRGRLRDAIRLLEAGQKKAKHPRDRHLRMAYAVADLHERAGDVPRARERFRWIDGQDPDFADVKARLAAFD